MNRIQFWTLISLSSLVVLLLLSHIILQRLDNSEKNRLAQAQQVVTQGQAFQSNLKQLAVYIYQDSQKTQDQGLKDLLNRQQIKYTPPSAQGADGSTSPDASSTPAPTTH